MQTHALLMTAKELQAAKETATGPLADAVWDEDQRRGSLTRHQCVRETGARMIARQNRQLRVEAIRGVRLEGGER